MSKKLTIEDVIARTKEKHGDKYNYTNSVYKNARTKMSIYCNGCCNTFYQTPDSHLRGAGCPKCNVRKPTRTTDEFIVLAQKVHHTTYNYDKVVYRGALKKVTIRCTIHGLFDQIAKEHLAGKGCNLCGYIAGTKKLVLTKETFLERCLIVHGDKYDYTRVPDHLPRRIRIGCKEHGVFEQTYLAHVGGQGCNACGNNTIGEKKRMTTEQYLNRVCFHATTDYSLVVYKGMANVCTFICREHGKYEQRAAAHLEAVGCSSCKSSTSSGELELQTYIASICEDVHFQDRKLLGGKELDIVCPTAKVAIEFNGNYFHSSRVKNKYYHIDKTNKAKEAGYRLIHIRDDEWWHKKDIVKSILANALGKTKQRIYARACTVDTPSIEEWGLFVDNNHIMGKCNSTYKVGLYYEGELVSTIGVDHRGNMVRFATLLGCVIVGGLSRLISHSPKKVVITYCERRLFGGKGYEAAGFVEEHRKYVPDLWFTNGPKVYNRRFFQKKNQIKRYDNFNWEHTEEKNARLNGVYQLWYCGTIKYVIPVDK